MHILLQVTDNFPSWISGRERMTAEKISWSISTKECCRTGAANSRPSDHQSSAHPTELPSPAKLCLFVLCLHTLFFGPLLQWFLFHFKDFLKILYAVIVFSLKKNQLSCCKQRFSIQIHKFSTAHSNAFYVL